MKIEEYSKQFQFYEPDNTELLLKFLKKANWKSFLELGCGDGALLYDLNRKGSFDNKKVYAVDLSKERIDLVKKINKNFICFVDDAGNIKSIGNECIDFIVSNQLIEHVHDDKALIMEIDRVLKTEGTAYISTVFKKKYGWYFYRCNRKWTLDPTHLREYTENCQLLDILKGQGLTVIENKKSLIYRPIIDFLLRRIIFWFSSPKRDIFNNPLLKLLRKIKIPIPGYYYWEIVCQKV